MAGGSGSQALILDIVTKFTDAGIKQAKSAVAGLNEGFANIAKFTETNLIRAFTKATKSLMALSKEILKVGAGFEQAIQNVVALRGAGKGIGVMVNAFENQARLLGKTTAFTATEVANGMLELARAGLGTQKVLSVIGPTLHLAGSQGAGLAASAKLMARTFAQFSLEAHQATMVADTFTTAMQNSLLSMTSLDTSMRYAGGAAGQYNHDIQETTAAVAMFMNITGLGSTAGTQFRQVLLSLAAPTRKAQKVLERYKLTAKDISPEFQNFAGIMENLKPLMHDSMAVVGLVSKRASASLQKILKVWHSTTKAGAQYHALLAKMKADTGVAELTYKKMIDTVSGQTTILQSKIQEVFIILFNSLKVDLKNFIKVLQAAVDQMAAVFVEMTPFLQSTFSDLFGLMGKNVDEFRLNLKDFVTKMSIQAVQFVNKLMRILSTLKEFLPFLKTIGKIMLSIWAAKIVVSFGAALIGLVHIFASIKVLIVAWNANLVTFAATLKTIPLAMATIKFAALGVAAAFAYWVISTQLASDNIEDTFRDIEKGIERTKAARDSFLAEEKELIRGDKGQEKAIKGYKELASHANELARNRVGLNKEEISLNQKLNERAQQRLNTLQKMKASEKEMKLLSGELLKLNYSIEKSKDGQTKSMLIDIEHAKILESLGVKFKDLVETDSKGKALSGVDSQVESLAKYHESIGTVLEPALKQIRNLTSEIGHFQMSGAQWAQRWVGAENKRRKILRSQIKDQKLLNKIQDASTGFSRLGFGGKLESREEESKIQRLVPLDPGWLNTGGVFRGKATGWAQLNLIAELQESLEGLQSSAKSYVEKFGDGTKEGKELATFLKQSVEASSELDTKWNEISNSGKQTVDNLGAGLKSYLSLMNEFKGTFETIFNQSSDRKSVV